MSLRNSILQVRILPRVFIFRGYSLTGKIGGFQPSVVGSVPTTPSILIKGNVMKFVQKCFAGGVICGLLFCLAIPIACLTGIGLNIYKLTQCDFQAPYKAEIIRGIGAFPFVPLGIVAGYLHINDTPVNRKIESRSSQNRRPVARFTVTPK